MKFDEMKSKGCKDREVQSNECKNNVNKSVYVVFGCVHLYSTYSKLKYKIIRIAKKKFELK